MSSAMDNIMEDAEISAELMKLLVAELKQVRKQLADALRAPNQAVLHFFLNYFPMF